MLELRILGGILLAEWRVGVRSLGFWALTAACCLAALFACGLEEMLPSIAAARLQSLTKDLLAFFFLLWWAAATHREAASEMEEMLFTKPTGSRELVWGKFLGNFALVGLAWLCAAGTVWIAQGGRGASWSPFPYLHALQRILAGLFFFSSLAYTFVLLARSYVAAGVVGLYWLLLLLARDHLGRLFTFFWSQNAGLYGPLGVGLLFLAVGGFRLRHRTRRGPFWAEMALAVASILLGVGLGVRQTLRSHDPPLHHDELSQAIASQHLREGERAPGFWVPGARGGWVRLSEFPQHIVVIGLWSPYSGESGRMLRDFQELWETYRGQGVACIAVAVAEEHRIARDMARENRWTFPLGVDVGAREVAVPSAGSPVAEAYDAGGLPFVVLTDRRRRVVRTYPAWTPLLRVQLEQELQALLQRYPWSGRGASS